MGGGIVSWKCRRYRGLLGLTGACRAPELHSDGRGKVAEAKERALEAGCSSERELSVAAEARSFADSINGAPLLGS